MAKPPTTPRSPSWAPPLKGTTTPCNSPQWNRPIQQIAPHGIPRQGAQQNVDTEDREGGNPTASGSRRYSGNDHTPQKSLLTRFAVVTCATAVLFAVVIFAAYTVEGRRTRQRDSAENARKRLSKTPPTIEPGSPTVDARTTRDRSTSHGTSHRMKGQPLDDDSSPMPAWRSGSNTDPLLGSGDDAIFYTASSAPTEGEKAEGAVASDAASMNEDA